VPPASDRREALDERLARQVPPAGPQGQPDRDLSVPGRGPRQQEVRDVRARDQENEADHRHQHLEGLVVILPERGDASCRGCHADRGTQELLLGVSAGPLEVLALDLGPQQRAKERLERRPGLDGGDARCETREDRQPGGPAVLQVEVLGEEALRHLDLHAHGYPDLRGVADLDTGEAARADPDNRERKAVDGEGVAQYPGSAWKRSPPSHDSRTSFPGSRTGSGRTRTWSSSVKIAVFAPMPSPIGLCGNTASPARPGPPRRLWGPVGARPRRGVPARGPRPRTGRPSGSPSPRSVASPQPRLRPCRRRRASRSCPPSAVPP
jgi:hypothetical protein